MKPLRDPDYLRHVKTFPCLVCRAPGVDPHHVKAFEQSAMAMRPGDDKAVPLCRRCHDELHAHGDEWEWWMLKGINPRVWATATRAAYRCE